MKQLNRIGIGGEYPLSAAIIAAHSNESNRGRNMAIAFASQGLGNLFAPLIILLLLVTGVPLDYTWRVGFVFPLLPLLVTLPFRVVMAKEEQERIIQSHSKLSLLTATLPDRAATFKRHLPQLFGTCMTWLLFDISFYGNALFSGVFINLLGLGGHGTAFQQTTNITKAMLLIAAMGLPGYIASIFLAERVGRKRLQLIGFVALAILFFVMGIIQTQLVKIPALFIFIYGLTFFFSNCGPNTTTYVLSAELFPPEIRATCNGISAARSAFHFQSFFKKISSNYFFS